MDIVVKYTSIQIQAVPLSSWEFGQVPYYLQVVSSFAGWGEYYAPHRLLCTSQAVRRTVYSEPGPLAFLPPVSSASNPFSVKVSEWPFCSFPFKSVCLVFKMWNMCIVLKKKEQSYNGKNESLISHCFSALASILCVCVHVFVYFPIHWHLPYALFFNLLYFLIYLRHLSISVHKVPALFFVCLFFFSPIEVKIRSLKPI